MTLIELIISGVAILISVVALRLWLGLRELNARFAGVLDVEKERDRIATERDKLRGEVDDGRARWQVEYEQTIEQLETLTRELDRVQDIAEMQSFGLYEPHYDYSTSEEYKSELKAIRDLQKQAIREKSAAVCDTDWEVEGSRAKGRAMTNRYIRLQLRAFNGESNATIAKVKYNNVLAMEQRLRKTCESINKIGKSMRCFITDPYLDLKIKELQLVHEYEEKRQEEKEEQRAIREQMREEARAEKEIEKAQLQAEKEEARYQEALEKARIEIAEAEGAKQEKLKSTIEELEQRLQEAHVNAERAKSRAQLTKSGHVYVISNVGSLGDDIYKIGMTRRLDPLDRVRELGDASVPFPFDIHAMIFAEDAPALENTLHKRFADRRVNLVNLRREFFSISLEEIAEVVHEHDASITVTMVAEAQQYRQSETMRTEKDEKIGPTKEELLVEEAKRQLAEMQASWESIQPSEG